jgi:hypothetical protein
MIFRLIKKIMVPSFCNTLEKWIYRHKSENRNFHKDILFRFDIYKESISISAHSKSDIMDNFGITGGIKQFFNSQVISIEEGLNQITFESSKAKAKYPQLDFFRKLELLEYDGKEYIKKRDNLSAPEKIDMILGGSKYKAKTVSVFEKYSTGTWIVSSFPPWHSDDVDEFGDRYDGELF